MIYYKWMYESASSIHRVPGFVFLSMADVQQYSKEFEAWCYGEGDKNLYTFRGMKPTQIKQYLTSYFGRRTPSYPAKDLDRAEVSKYLDYFAQKPDDYFARLAVSKAQVDQAASLV